MEEERVEVATLFPFLFFPSPCLRASFFPSFSVSLLPVSECEGGGLTSPKITADWAVSLLIKEQNALMSNQRVSLHI